MFGVSRHPLAKEVQTLVNSLIIVELSDLDGVLARMEVKSSFLNRIKARQFKDAKLSKIRDKVLHGETKEAVIDNQSVLRIKGCVCATC